MRRLIVLSVFALFALTATGHAQSWDIGTSRLYKLCWMEDPSCITNLRHVMSVLKEKVAKEPEGNKSFCLNGRTPSDQWLYNTFMLTMQSGDVNNNLSTVELMRSQLFVVARCR